MKNIFYLLFGLLLISSFAFGQEHQERLMRDKNYNPVDGWYNVSEGKVKSVSEVNPLPVTLTNPTSSTDNYISYRLTSTVNVDSLEFGFTSRAVTIFNHSSVSTNDTLYVCAYDDFRSGKVIMILPGMGTTWNNAWNKVFYKFNTIPVAGKPLEIGAN